MAFEMINEEKKQHLSLSTHANTVIEHDMSSFNIKHKSSFINQIYKNYHSLAECSLSSSAVNFREELKNLLKSSGIDCNSEAARSIIQAQETDYIRKIQARYSRIPRNHPFKIKINQENYKHLFFGCSEDRYYKTAGHYIKAVIEEYCQKSFLEREEIYAKENFETIEEAIRYKKILKLQSATGEMLKLKPYRIIPDPLSMYHYLIGYAVPESDSPESESYSYSCRISNLKYIKMLHEKSFITQNDKKSLEKELQKKGSQFMIGELCEARIYLTDEGISLYNRIWHLRPQYTNISPDGHTYTFLCSPNQIHYYFFKFGKEAIVLSPEDLRIHMNTMYKEAVEAYKQIP